MPTPTFSAIWRVAIASAMVSLTSCTISDYTGPPYPKFWATPKPGYSHREVMFFNLTPGYVPINTSPYNLPDPAPFRAWKSWP